jgi:hypothetical protein
MQAKTVNSNAMDDMFVAFTMVQQIMTGLSCAASGEEEVSAITKDAFILLKHNGGNSSQGFGRQAYELQKQMKELKRYVARFLGDKSETAYEVLHSQVP